MSFIKFESLGSSVGNLDIPLLKISNFESKNARAEEKSIILIIGRQHPGETYSSFIIHGFVNQMLQKTPLCNQLRESYEIWVVPMLNPDGVVVGNYRSNLQGRDLNRHFFSGEDLEGARN